MSILGSLIFSRFCTANVRQISQRQFARKMATKSALVILAPGAEEMEFVISTDVLRRAGVNVTVAGLEGPEKVVGSRDIVIVPDVALESTKSNKYDVIVLPGGFGGAEAMSKSALLGELLKAQESEGRLIAAICAAPTVLKSHGIATGKSLTSYPLFKEKLQEDYKYIEDQPVVQDGNFITSRGPGTTFAFALKLSEILVGADKANDLAKALLIK